MRRIIIPLLLCVLCVHSAFSQCNPTGTGLAGTATAFAATCPLNGSIAVSVTASTSGAPYTFRLTAPCISIPVVQSQSSTNYTFNALQGNCTYTVCISDAGGNIISKTATVIDSYNPLTGLTIADEMFSTVSCSQLIATVTGGRSPYSYELFLGATANGTPVQASQPSNTFSNVNPATQYTIRATDACGQSIVASRTTGPLKTKSITITTEALESCTRIREFIFLNGGYGGANFDANDATLAASSGIKLPIVITARDVNNVLLAGYPYTLTNGNPAGWGLSPNINLPYELRWSPPVPNNPAIFPVTFSFSDACGTSASVVKQYNTEFSKAAYVAASGTSLDTNVCPLKTCIIYSLAGNYVQGTVYPVGVFTNPAGTGTPLQTINYPSQNQVCGLSFNTTYYFKVHDPCLNKDTLTSFTTGSPLPPFTVSPTSCSSFCNGSMTGTFTYTGFYANSVVATSGPASFGPYPKPVIFSSGTTPAGIISITGLPAGSYTLVFSNKCNETATQTLTVAAGSLSAAPDVTVVTTGCASATVTVTPHISATGQMLDYHTTPGCHTPAGVSYYSNIIFSQISGGGPIPGSGNINVDNPTDGYTANITSPGTYVAIIAYSQGLPGLNNSVSSCYQTVRDTFVVAFNTIPTIVRVYTLPCVAGSYSIVPVAPNAVAGTQYTLYASNGTTVLAGPQTSNTFSNITTSAGTNLIIKAQDPCGQVSTVPFTITTSTNINGSVNCTTALIGGISVRGDSLRADFINGATYLWTAPNGTTYTGATPPFVVPSQTGTWTLSTTIQSGPCTAVLTNSFTTVSCEFGPPPPPPPPPPNRTDPVQLTAATTLCKVKLDWATITEVISLRFEVEESTDNVNWHVVATVAAAGNSNTVQHYSVTLTPGTSHVYYRVKQIDTDAQFKYSNTVEVTTVCPTTSGTDILITSTNPATTGSNISFSFFSSAARGNAVLIFTDAIGRQYLKEPVAIISGMNYYNFKAPQYLAKGTYFVTLVTLNNNWRSNTVKLVLIK